MARMLVGGIACISCLTGAAFSAQRTDPVESHAPIRLIARTAIGVCSDDAIKAVELLGGGVIRECRAVRELIVAVPPGEGEAVAGSLRAAGLFEYIVNDLLCEPLEIPNDPLFPDQWHLPRIEAPAAWSLSIGSADVVVAVVDGGVDLDHPELQPLLVPGYNSVSRTAQADGGLVDDVNGHGTAVAGSACAMGNNAEGVVGVGWQMRVMPIRASNSPAGSAFLSDLLDGARWAVDHGARAVNVSYSGVQNASVQTTGEYVMDHGGLLFYSAGNSSQRLDSFDHASVIIVGSTTPGDLRSNFSAFGIALDVFAPGQDILTTIPNGYGLETGTSFAAPIAAGIIGMIWSAAPALSPTEVQSILFSTCDDIGEAGDDAIFGHGRVNLRRAVEAALGAACPADLDGDRAIGLADLAILLSGFGTTTDVADLDGDGEVGISDLALLLSHFGEDCD